MKTEFTLTLAALAAFALAGTAAAQHDEHHEQPKHQDKPAHAEEPAHHADADDDDDDDDRIGDPYTLDVCPISGKKLGEMGDPVVKLYDKREVRFCCTGCPPKFEKDLAASFAKLDQKITKDQAPLYPLKTSVVTGKELPEKAFEFVYGNRLVRVGAEGEKAEFLKDPKKHIEALDKAVIAAQSADYPLKTCPASTEALGGDMGKPVDMVVAGRLIRLCCKDCKEDIEKEPAKFIAMIDTARKGEEPKHDADHKDDHHAR